MWGNCLGPVRRTSTNRLEAPNVGYAPDLRPKCARRHWRCGSLVLHMASLHPGVTGRKSDRQSDSCLPPILVSVRQARALLADMSKDKLWSEITAGKLGEILGTPTKRFLYYKNVKAYADNLPRAPYSVSDSKAGRQTGWAPVVGKGGGKAARRKAARNKTTGSVGKGSGEVATT
jgi:hypothetical protein